MAAERWHERYYGAVDSTPLFVMLLAESCRWTGSLDLAVELEQPARRAIDWICARIDEDDHGLLGYWRRAERGLDVQSWKDSHDSQRDRMGRIASGRIRPLEAQAYAVAALRAGARIATLGWNDDVIASEWAGLARQLERRIIDRFHIELPESQLQPDDPRTGGFLALAVDEQGLPLDSLTSNIGHVLWADAVADPILRQRIVAQVSHDALNSGWGVRTMSTLDAGYDASSQHCGSVWPHDTTIAIAGVARVDRDAAGAIARNLLDAAAARGGRLPELFAGTPRDVAEPQMLPAACSPQAWSAAAPLLLVRSMLGLEPDANGVRLTATTAAVPSWLHGLRWRGVQAVGKRWDVIVAPDGMVDVSPEAS